MKCTLCECFSPASANSIFFNDSDSDLRPHGDVPPTPTAGSCAEPTTSVPPSVPPVPPVVNTEMATAVLAPSKRNSLIGKPPVFQVGTTQHLSCHGCPCQRIYFEGSDMRGCYPRHGRARPQHWTCGGAGSQSGGVEVGVLAGHDVGAPSHLGGCAAADSGGGGGRVHLHHAWP